MAEHAGGLLILYTEAGPGREPFYLALREGATPIAAPVGEQTARPDSTAQPRQEPGNNVGQEQSGTAQKSDALPGKVGATQHSSGALGVPEFSLGNYISSLGVLFLLLGGLWFLARIFKKRGGMRFFTGAGDDLAVESRLSLGPKKNLLVVRFLNKKLLLGVTEQNICLLATEESAEESSENEAAPPGDTKVSGRASRQKQNFSQALQGASTEEAAVEETAEEGTLIK